MKQYITIKRTVLKVGIALSMMLSVNTVYAQFDMGVVWQKDNYTTLESNIINISKQTDGTYIGAGALIQNGKRFGYLIHFNEAGEKIDDYILALPTGYTEADTGVPVNSLQHAYLTSDNCIIAFGTLHNAAVPDAIKGHNFTNMIPNGQLQKGLWVTKVAISDKSIKLNKLDRSNSGLTSSYHLGIDRFIMVGRDYQPSANNSCMLRVYDKDGNWIYDNYTGGSAINLSFTSQLSDFDATSFTIDAIEGVFKINKSNYNFANGTASTSVLVTAIQPGIAPCLPSDLPGFHHPYFAVKNGGFWVMGRMAHTSDAGGSYAWGEIFYEKNNSNQLIECKQTTPIGQSTYTNYHYPPMLLPGSSVNYIGTISKLGINHMYVASDDPSPLGGFTLIDNNNRFSFNTALNATSHTDGFFSVGQNTETKHAAIVKYSTCVNFKINNLPTDNKIIVDHAPNVNINIPLDYVGAKATSGSDVKYDLQAYVEVGTVDGKTSAINGGLLENSTNQAVSNYIAGGSGKALDLNRTYAFAEGGVVIKYILFIKDSYTTAGVPQSCGQTYIFYLRSAPQAEVVAMPNIIQEGSTTKVNTSIKNIGQAAFANPFSITVYKDAVGDATKHTYTYSKAIARNETVHFEFDIPTWANTGKLVIQINDDGTGDGQTEANAGLHTYEIN